LRDDVGVATEAPPAPRLLDRDEPLAALEALARRAHDGEGATAVVAGEAGIGKTALVDALADRLTRDGGRVLRAAGGELERDVPFGVVRALLAPLAGATALTGAAAFSAPVFAADAGAAPTEIGAVLHGLYWLVAEGGPLTLVVDDAQWCDGPSLRFLAYLARRLDDLPCLLVVATRPTQELELDAVTARAALRLELGPLGGDAIAQLLGRELGDEVAPSFAHACREATRGNAFLTVALARELAARSVRGHDAELPAIAEAGGGDVAVALERRLLPHGPGAQRLARAVAILGPAATFRRACALAEVDPLDGARLVEALVGERLLADARPLAFVHPLVRAAVVEAMSADDRALGHARAAALLAADGDREEAAHHLLVAAPGGDPLAVAVLRHAAEGALSRAAPDAAAAYLERALQEQLDAADRAAVLERLALAGFLQGGPGLAVQRLQEAMALAPDAATRERLAVKLGRALQWTGAMHEGTLLLRDEVRGADPEAAQEARLLMEITASGHLAARVLSGDAVAALRAREHIAADDHAGLAALAIELGMWSGPVDRTLRAAEGALAGVELLPSEATMPLRSMVGVVVAACDERALSLAAIQQELAEARARGSAVLYAQATSLHAWAHWRFGDLAEAEAEAGAVLGLDGGPELNHILHGPAVAVMAAVVLEREGPQAAREVLERHPVPEDPGLTPRQQLSLVRAAVALGEGRPDAALDELETCAAYERDGGLPSTAVLPWRALAVRALLALDRRPEAIALAGEFHDHAEAFGAPGTIGRALHARGLAEDDIALLEAAIVALARSPARLAHAEALFDLGCALRAAGRDVDARGPLRAALDLAVACGARRLADRAAAALRQAGGRPRRLRSTGADALTPAELRTARLAISGLTNREIAQASFLSPRTVEMHLSNAYRKLGIGGRDELAAALP
jgi:DNA-binding CsgD family transcriptional regulator